MKAFILTARPSEIIGIQSYSFWSPDLFSLLKIIHLSWCPWSKPCQSVFDRSVTKPKLQGKKANQGKVECHKEPMKTRFWLLDKFSFSAPQKCTENSMENMHKQSQSGERQSLSVFCHLRTFCTKSIRTQLELNVYFTRLTQLTCCMQQSTSFHALVLRYFVTYLGSVRYWM